MRSNVSSGNAKRKCQKCFPSPWFVLVYLLCLWQSFHIVWLFFIVKQCFAHLCETGRWATNVAYPRVGWVGESRNNHKRPQLSSPSHWQQLYMSSSGLKVLHERKLSWTFNIDCFCLWSRLFWGWVLVSVSEAPHWNFTISYVQKCICYNMRVTDTSFSSYIKSIHDPKSLLNQFSECWFVHLWIWIQMVYVRASKLYDLERTCYIS